MLKYLCLVAFFLTPGFGAMAQDAARLDPLVKALQLREIFAVMRDEGIANGDDLDMDMLAGRGGATWQKTVKDIYSTDRVWNSFFPRFAADLEGKNVAAMVEFFASKRGRRIVTLEVSARRALLDKALEEASIETLAEMTRQDHPRLAMLKEFVEANDLVDFNVTGAMNANYAFYTGLIEGKAFEYEMTEQEILNEVWLQEAEIRASTEEWVYSYLVLAFQPLSDEDLQAYIDFSNTKAGRDLNAALFAGFDDMFSGVSNALGQSAARFMVGEDL